MTLSEFKAWLEGFSEGIETAPTEKQFEKIKAKVAEINSVPVTREVFVERYRDIWPRYRDTGWPQPIVSYSAGAAPLDRGVGRSVLMNESAPEWDGYAAMRALGSVEAAN